MRSIATIVIVSILSLPQLVSAADWQWLPYKDAVAIDAESHAPKAASGKVPHLVVSCNNLIRLAYLEWPSNLGVKLKELPNHADVKVTLLPNQEMAEIWFVSRPEKKVTTIISHDRAFPRLLSNHQSVTLRARDKKGLFDLAATFPLVGLTAIMEAHNLPCR